MPLTHSPKRRPVVPLCLTLGALLCALPALADPPAAPAVGVFAAQTIPLRHTDPGSIILLMQWYQPSLLPAGVTQVLPLLTDNALSVTGTPTGLNAVHQIVKILDIFDSSKIPVQISVALAWATAADLKTSGINFDSLPLPTRLRPPVGDMGYAVGGSVAQLLQTLRTQGTILWAPSLSGFVRKNITLSLPSLQPRPVRPALESFTFAVAPRVNSDDSVTLALCPQATWRVAGETNPDGTPATATFRFQTPRPVRNGDTLVFTNLCPDTAGVGSSQLLLFVTPTIAPLD